MRSFLAAGLALLLLLGGCATGKTVAPLEPKGFPSPHTALAAIKPREKMDTLYRLTAKVSISALQGKLNFRLAVIMQSPDKLRIESIPILGPPDFFLAAQGGHFRVYLPGTQEFIAGKASPAHLARFLPISWSAERWMAILQGYGPDVSSNAVDLRGKMEGPLYRIDMLSRDSILESIWINPERSRLEKMERFISAGLKETVVFSAFRPIDGREFPGHIRIESEEGKVVGIMYETIETSTDIPDDLFTLLPPPDVTVTNLPD